jgi:Ca2+-binding RTX toxin-like protein
MQGVCLSRHPPGRRRAAGGLSAAICLLALVLPAPAAAYVRSGVADGRLIARSDELADIIKISCGADLRVKVNGLEPTDGGAPCSAIRRVQVFGFRGADTINVSRVGPRNGFGHPGLLKGHAVQADGGQSSDRISGSRLSDFLVGGEGHDVLRGRAGADLLRGERGSDRLVGGKGRDVMIGSRGEDLLQGGRGNDVNVDR